MSFAQTGHVKRALFIRGNRNSVPVQQVPLAKAKVQSQTMFLKWRLAFDLILLEEKAEVAQTHQSQSDAWLKALELQAQLNWKTLL